MTKRGKRGNSRKRENKQTIYRLANVHKPFSQLGNVMLQDKRLSLEARGLLGSIMSRPRDWQFNLSWLQKEHDIGREKCRRLIKELSKAGYCIRSRAREPDGTLGGMEYAFTDDPERFEEQRLNPAPENPSAVTST